MEVLVVTQEYDPAPGNLTDTSTNEASDVLQKFDEVVVPNDNVNEVQFPSVAYHDFTNPSNSRFDNEFEKESFQIKELIAATAENNNDDEAENNNDDEDDEVEEETNSFSFVFHSKLNIRDKEEAELIEAYQRLFLETTQTEFVIISGPTGVGKTTLAQSLCSKVMEDGGIFCQGKFDSLQSHEPYAAFVAALTEFTQIVVERGNEAIASMRESILSAVGSEGKVLTDTIPALAQILGDQPERSHTLPTVDSLNQFKFLFRMFLRAVCSPEQPMVLFLDDLHWADESSIILLQSLVTDLPNKGILFVSTIRNDVVPCRKLEDGLEQFCKAGVRVTKLELQNLQDESVQQMLSQLLHVPVVDILPLSGIVHRQTDGNVFFILEMLESLHDDGLLRLDQTISRWSWNEQDIRLMFQQTTVRELVTDRIFQLPKEAQDLLKVAACLGSNLDVQLLSYVLLSVSVEIYLQMAADNGLLSVRGTPKRYQFAHDGILEATYNLISAQERPNFHLDIGRALKRLTTEQLDGYIFVVLGQLERGSVLILNRRERSEVAALYLRGGAHAVRSSSFKTASKYFLLGIQMLDDNSWKDEYDLCLELYNCAAEIEYCNGHFASVDSLADTVISMSKSFCDTLRIRACQVYSLGGRNLMNDAIFKGVEVLKALGISFPRKPGRFDVKLAIRRTRSSLRKLSPEDILTLPLMRDPEKLAPLQMMNLLFLYTFSAQSLLAPLIVCRMVDLTVEHGLCAMSSCALTLFAGLLIGFQRRMDEGLLYGELALDLYEKFDEKAWLGRLSASYYAFVSGWKHPLREVLAPLKEAHRVALATGDIEMAMMNANIYCWSAMEFEPIPVLEKEIESFVNSMERYGQASTSFMIQPLWQLCQNLLGMAAGDPKMLIGNVMNQHDYFGVARNVNPPSVLWANFYLAQLAYLFGDYNLAEERIGLCRDLALFPFCSFSSVNIVFYDCLIALALFRKDRRDRGRRIRLARRAIKLMSRWSDDAPINFLGKLFLLKAELAAAVGTPKAAVHNLTCAVALSSKGGFLMLEALANERAGRYYLERRDLSLAADSLGEAHTLYVKWGGCAKAEHLQCEIDRLLKA